MKRLARMSASILGFGSLYSVSSPASAQSTLPPLFDVSLGARVLSRTLRYTDTLPERVPTGNADAPRDFSMPFGPSPFVQAGYYPFAGKGWFGNIGVVGSFETLLFTSSTSSHPDLAGKELPTTYYRYGGGLRARLPLRSGDLGVTARYAGQDFSVTGSADSNGRDLYPGTGYSSIEGLLDGEYRVGPVAIGGYAGYLQPIAFGALGSRAWFPEVHGFGLCGGGYVSYFFTENFGLTLSVDSRAYGLDFNPVPVKTASESDRVAGGATDRYLSFGGGLTFRLPAPSEKPAATGASVEVKPKDNFDSFE